jgi:hypothetical protein
MDVTEQEILAIITALPPPRRVAIACVAVEHLLELHRRGNAVAVADKAIAGVPAGSDLVDAGLQLAWRYAQGQPADMKAVNALQQTLKKLRKQLLARVYHAEHKEPLLGVAIGPLIGVDETLRSVEAAEPIVAVNAMGRAVTSIYNLVVLFTDDEKLPTKEMYREVGWQLKVARRVRDLGPKPVQRAAFADLLAEKLPWHRYLDDYSERIASVANAKPASATNAKRTPKAAAKPNAKPKPASKPKPAASKPTRGAAATKSKGKPASRPVKRKA